MPADALSDDKGRGHRNLAHDTISLSDGDTHDFAGELRSIDRSWAESSTNDNAGTTMHIASTTDSGTVVTLNLADLDTSAGGSAVTGAENVDLFAVGDA